MTAPDPAPATLDAAVEAAARFAYERACSVAAAPEQMVTWDRLSGHMRRYYLIQYGPVVAAAGHADLLAQAHAAGTAEGATAERERIAQVLEVEARKPLVYSQTALRAAAAIARAGTSGADR